VVVEVLRLVVEVEREVVVVDVDVVLEVLVLVVVVEVEVDVDVVDVKSLPSWSIPNLLLTPPITVVKVAFKAEYNSFFLC